MRFSVIMPVNLNGYEVGAFKSASSPECKFVRAVNSFLFQSFQDAELIIISDGCDKAENIYRHNYKTFDSIKFMRIEKQLPFSGTVRQAGLDVAKGDIQCYLDHDDMFGKNHLQIINYSFTDDVDWVYYNDYLVLNKDHSLLEERTVKVEQNHIGTSAIAHRKTCDVVWGDGYGHDMDMIKKYLILLPHAKIPTPEYYVCHCSGLNIDF